MINLKSLLTTVCGAVFGLLLSTSSFACTTIIVMPGASADHSIIIARNVDGETPSVARHVIIHPQQHYPKGSVFHSNLNDFTYPNPQLSARYSGVPAFGPGKHPSFEESGFNQYGVAVSATETIVNSKRVLAIDPYVTKTGINEDSITSVLLRRAHTAREGAALLGHIISTQGTAEGFGVAIGDKHEVWYLETASGHRWVAERLPNDVYFVSANQSRLQHINLKDKKNFMGSPDLIQFAIKNKLYNPASGKPFNFRLAFSRFIPHDIDYNYTRVWRLQHLFNPSLKNAYQPGEFKTFLKPAHKITLAQVKAGLRDYYQGTSMDPYTKKGQPQLYRPIGVFRAGQSHILVIHPELPNAIGDVEYLALGMPTLSPYTPLYEGITTMPTPYIVGRDGADNQSAYWIYRKMQTMAMLNFADYEPIVAASNQQLSQHIAQQQQQLVKHYLAIYQQQPQKAQQLIQDFTNQEVKEALQATQATTNKLFTLQTNATMKNYMFPGE